MGIDSDIRLAGELLESLRVRGFVVSSFDDGSLSVSPRSDLSEEDCKMIQMLKPPLLEIIEGRMIWNPFLSATDRADPISAEWISIEDFRHVVSELQMRVQL